MAATMTPPTAAVQADRTGNTPNDHGDQDRNDSQGATALADDGGCEPKKASGNT
jgi:hypothetical protein